ncbi:MAG: winged helix-turn-helix transcriptional regulator [Candidatus Heimdallarchaeota archaeon]|nr:winged helix-turn-helix transcriptional regulator [Candidatus Heimdallarchaeota archaeon]
MRRNPYISAREIAEIINISDRKTETNIAKLKKMDLIKRIGPAKGGYWGIVIDCLIYCPGLGSKSTLSKVNK